MLSKSLVCWIWSASQDNMLTSPNFLKSVLDSCEHRWIFEYAMLMSRDFGIF